MVGKMAGCGTGTVKNVNVPRRRSTSQSCLETPNKVVSGVAREQIAIGSPEPKDGRVREATPACASVPAADSAEGVSTEPFEAESTCSPRSKRYTRA